jgi:hypothetical protein
MLLLSGVFVFFSAWVAVIIFPRNEPEFQQEMHDVWGAVWQMYILITTANFPDVMMPAYIGNRGACGFFVLFLVCGLWFIGSSITAVVFATFQAEESKKAELNKMSIRRSLAKAFEKLDRLTTENKRLNIEEVQQVVMELKSFCHVEEKGLFERLDQDHDGSLSWEEFEAFGNRLTDAVISSDPPGLFDALYPETPPWLSNLKKAMLHPAYNWCMALLLIWGAKRTMDRTNHHDDFLVTHVTADLPFTLLFALEVAVKIATLGWGKYSRSLKHKFEFGVSVLAVGGLIYTEFLMDLMESEINDLSKKAHLQSVVSADKLLRSIIAVQVLRVARLAFYVPQYQVMLKCLSLILADTGDVFKLLFVVMFAYGCLGVQLFGGTIKISPGNHTVTNPLVQKEWDGASGYFATTFNDLMSAMVTLFEVLIGNNWFEICNGMTAAVGHYWARFYFIGWIIVGSQVFLNVVLSIIIGAFSDQFMSQRDSRQLVQGGTNTFDLTESGH